MKRLLLLATALAAVAALASCPKVEESATIEPEFSQSEYEAHLRFLASDLLEGRAIGARGGDLAAEYIAAQFEAIGLQPISEEEGYFQHVPLLGISTDLESVRFSLRIGSIENLLEAHDEVVINSELTDAEINAEGELLFVGYGIESPEYEWDDYKGVDVGGRILVMLVNDPDLELTGFGSEEMTYYGRWTYKEEISRAKGARGLILLHTDETATYPFTVVQSSWANERIRFNEEVENPLVLNGWISRPAIEPVLEQIGTSYDELKARADSRDFVPEELGITLTASFNQTTREFTSPNVIGIMPGSSMSDEAVIYEGHYDHFGIGRPVEGDNIYNGALDNASGISALICMARAYASLPEPPARSLVFFATTGEESGLLGAEYYVANPIVPLEDTAIVINMDSFNVFGPTDDFVATPIEATTAGLTFDEIGRGLDMELAPNPRPGRGSEFRSDHFPFNARGVVALSVDNGLQFRGKPEGWGQQYMDEYTARHYHQPSDEIGDDWDYSGATQLMLLCYRLGRHWADGADAPSLREDNPYVPAIRMRGLE